MQHNRSNYNNNIKLKIYVIISIVLFAIYIYYAIKNWQFDNLSHLLFKTPLASFITLNVLVAIVSALMCTSQNNERKLQSSASTNTIDKGLSSPLSNKTSAWITDPSERHSSLEERKRTMIDQARKKYLEKHPDISINTPSKSKKVE